MNSTKHSPDSTGIERAEVAVQCKVCDSASSLFGEATVLRKYPVKYFRCSECGFIQTESPYWLDEAYSSAIASQDVGVMQRNLVNCEITSAVLNLLYPKVMSAIDFGAGHGVLVRLMRDRGFNFFWSDPYATNDYARGFESPSEQIAEFLTAFEVLEHLSDPVAEISKLLQRSDNVLASTCLVSTPPPALPDWWYYMQSSGQHISFYTPQSLQAIGRRFNRYVISAGQYHLFSRRPVNAYLYRLACRPRIARFLNKAFRRPSLTSSDFEKMTTA